MAAISSDVQRLLNNNQSHQQDFKPPLSIADFRSLMIEDPSLDFPRICIITCCDSRVIPEHIFQLGAGEAIVMRTAGGSVRPALSALLAIDSLLPIKDIIVMRHTDCGTAHWTDESVRAVLRDRCGDLWSGQQEIVDGMDFCSSQGDAGDEMSLQQDVEWLKSSPLMREQFKQRIIGMIYQTATGQVDVVC